VFSLVQEKSRSLEEFYRILQPGGHLVLSDLYIPEKYLSAVKQYQGDGPFTSCMAGAMGIIDLIRILENAGFTITLMEDQTRFLKQLAGQIVFEYGSLERFWDALPGAAGGGHLTHMCRNGSLKLGYGLFVATKYR
jgi:arsenite methyltransferase